MAFSTLSIDWEDFGQLYGKYHYKDITEPVNGAIERQTDIILDLLDETGHKATFFVLGILAKYRPGLVKKIAAKGHEIALHGQNHEAMFSLSPQAAQKDLEDSLKIVSDITGDKIYGYRAPFFSVNETNLYVLEILAELGLTYDSSIFPIKMSRYGIEGFNQNDALYQLQNGMEIVELPLTISQYVKKKWPVSGGGYIRLMPKFLVNKVFADFKTNGKDSMIYMHPYEFDTNWINVSDNYPNDVTYSKIKVFALNLRWNLFRNSVREKIKSLLQQHQFKTCLEKANYVKSNGNSTKLLGCPK
ncbi:MAG: polysaccharide deacetylase family protein [Chitinophagaceae bacterium]|nr:polysaccharide deacetylase family protein [Chitinophagaceae bacterium]